MDSGGVREYEEAWELANITNQPGAARRAAASLAWLHADHGRLNDANAWVIKGETVESVETRYDAPLHLAASMIAIDRLDKEGADRHLKKLGSVPVGEYWAAEIWVRARNAISERDAVRVEGLISRQLVSQPPGLYAEGAHRRYLAASQADLATTRQRPAPQLDPVDKPSAFDQVLEAAAAYRSGRMNIVLRQAVAATRANHNPRLRSAGLLLTAAARLTLRRPTSAAKAFTTAHAIIEAEQIASSYQTISTEHLVELARLAGIQLETRHAVSTVKSADPDVLASLTRRERQLLALLASDSSFKTIADALVLSPNTVKGTTSSLYRKLGVHSRQAAADIAHRVGLT
jgi:DNA-binding NarL/FixJ family response regulator